MRGLFVAMALTVLLISCGQSARPENPLSQEQTDIDSVGSATDTPTTTGIATIIPTEVASATTALDQVEEVQQPETENTPALPIPTQPPPNTQEPISSDTTAPSREPQLQEYPVPAGSRPHDVAPAPDGTIWYTAQRLGELGRLDPATGETHHIPLGPGSAPHGVIVGPDDAAWVTDSGLNAIVRVDPLSEEVLRFDLPAEAGYTNLNTATFDANGVLWFTGQSGFYGRLDPASGQLELFAAPRGRGPYGITTSPDGAVYYASLAGSYVGSVDPVSGDVTVLEPPTPNQGARRVWSDSSGRIWVSEWNAGQLAVLDPATGEWREWLLPGAQPMPYAVYVDETDMIWLSDFGANALVRFDPEHESFEFFPLSSPGANVRQILGRPGEIWGAESGTDRLVVIRTR